VQHTRSLLQDVDDFGVEDTMDNVRLNGGGYVRSSSNLQDLSANGS